MADTVYISTKVSFSAAHRMFRPDLSDEENMRIFGKCANPGAHGHNYVVEVTLRGTPDENTGMVTDLAELKHHLRREVVDKLDHRHLNEDVEGLKGKVPSVENLVRLVWDTLEPGITGCELYEVRIWETDKNCAWYRGGA